MGRAAIWMVVGGLLSFIIISCGGSGSNIPNKGWGAAEQIGINSVGPINDPQVEFDTSGNALAVWRQQDETQRSKLWFNDYSSVNGWGVAEMIDSSYTGSAYNHQFALDSDGNAIVVWQEYNDSKYDIWAIYYTAGSGWGTAELIETENIFHATSPQVAFDANGNAIAVWLQNNGIRDDVWANSYTAGSGWGTAEFIGADFAYFNALEPQVAIDKSGNILVVWSQVDDGSRRNIWANSYTTGSDWGVATELIEAFNFGNAGGAQAAFGSNGSALVVWHQSNTSLSDIWAKSYSFTTGWGTSKKINQDSGNFPQVASDENGKALAVWALSDGIGANNFSDENGWGTAEKIEININSNAHIPKIDFNSKGTAHVVWKEFDGVRYNAWANLYSVDSGWGVAELIETDKASIDSFPQITLDDLGNALAIWSRFDGSVFNVWVNCYK